MTGSRRLTRRRFLRGAAGVGAAVVAAPQILAEGEARAGPSERIRLGFIGVGPRGTRLLDTFRKEPDVSIAAICDVWEERRQVAVARCEGKPRGFRDFREVLERRDIDAVVIATPPHWHALLGIHACEAGKDFYVEKPMTLGVGESLALRRSVARHGRITQVGTQIHASSNYRQVVETVRSGRLGPIPVVRTFMVMNQAPDGIGTAPESDPPAGLDWDLWCGPAPLRPFNRLIVKNAFHHSSFMNYGGGWTPGMAPHILDLPWWALELGFPSRVSSSGGRHVIRDAGDCPDTHEVTLEFPGLTLTWMMSLANSYGFDFQGEEKIRRRLGVYFHGVKGTLLADYTTHRIVGEGDRLREAPSPEKPIPESPGHQREWLDSLRTREPPSCPVEYHHRIDVAIALANLSLALGRSLRYDPETASVPGDREATGLLVPDYRAPWKLPEGYL